MPGTEVVSQADCFLPRYDQAAKLIPGGEKIRKYQHYRDMLEKLDAMFVETSIHARLLTVIHALQAGCDVYA